jgi:hypothetical protein
MDSVYKKSLKEMCAFNRGLVIVRVAGLAAVFVATVAQAQDFSKSDLRVTPTETDRAAALEAKNLTRHAQPPSTSNAPPSRTPSLITPHPAINANNAGNGGGSNAPLRPPGDMSYQGGAVVEFAESHAVYLNPNGTCKISVCWGAPEGYLRNLGISDFIHVADQYVGLSSSGRYTVGKRAVVDYTPASATAPGFTDYQPFTDADMQAVVHAVASPTGQTGYGHIYHVFLPPGQDECFDSTFSVCYSPDNPNTFAFCAYHSSVDFTDIGHVLYTVEPFQNNYGCAVKPGTPNGQLVDSTDNALNHETFETITDPDGTAWWNSTNIGLFDQEVGDECTFVVSTGWDVPTVFIGTSLFAVQRIYSNSQHTCSNTPWGSE